MFTTTSHLYRSPSRSNRLLRLRLRRYYLPVRCTDAIAGFRDGRRGLPLHGPTTQYAHRLATMAEEQGRSIRHQLDLALKPLLRERAAVTTELQLANAAVADLHRRVVELAAQDESLPPACAHPGSEAELGAARARLRLTGDTQKTRTEARAGEQRSRQMQVRLNELDADVLTVHALAVSHLGRCVEHYQRRTQTYLRALVRRQPQRPELAQQLDRTPIVLPTWAATQPATGPVFGSVAGSSGPVLSLAPQPS